VIKLDFWPRLPVEKWFPRARVAVVTQILVRKGMREESVQNVEKAKGEGIAG